MSDSVREAFEALEQAKNKFEMCGATFEFDTIKAALSANGGEAVGYTGSGSLDALKQGAEGHIFPSPAPSHPVPLYLSPTVKDSLTVQNEPIGYADPDTLTDYRAGDRLHMPVYRPDASADWQDGVPVYLHPAPPSVAVPEGWSVRQVEDQGNAGFIVGSPRVNGVRTNTSVWRDDEDPAHQLLAHMLAAAPSLDHSGDANKMADDLPVAIPESEFDETNPIHQAADAYSYACEIMEQHQAKRVNAGKDPGTIGSLCDGIAWLYERIQELEDAPSVPENEIKAQALEWFADWLKRQSFAHKKRWTSAANEALRCAARLRTAGDEGEE